MSPNTRKRIVIVVLIILGVMVSYAAAFLILQRQAAALAIRKQEVAAQEEAFQELVSLEQTIRTTEDERKELASLFVEGNSIVDFLNLVEYYADLSDVHVEVKSVSLTTQDILQVSLVGDGDYNAIMKYLQLVEHNPFHTRLFQLNVTRSTTEQQRIATEVAPAVDSEVHVPGAWQINVTIDVISYSARL